MQNGEPFTYLDDKPLAIAEGGGARQPARSPASRCAASRPRDIPAIALRLLSAKRSVVGHRQIIDFRDVDGLRCVSADGRPIPLHVDGDHIGDVTEAVFGVRPGALAVVA